MVRLPAALAASAALLTLPAAAHADATITGGPVKVKDYRMTVMASDGKQDSLYVMFVRGTGKAMQMHTYSFSTGVDVKIASSLASASVKGSLGKYGSVNFKLAKPGSMKTFAPPAGCTGTRSKGRAATLAGSLKLIADTTYFKTVTTKKLTAMASKAGDMTCGGTSNPGSGGSKGGIMLSSTTQGPEGMLSVSASSKGGAVSQTVMRMDDSAKTAPASIMHMISVQGGAFDAAADLSTASVHGAGGFLTGKAAFSGEPAGATMAMGTLGGDYTARFDSIGSIAIGAAGADAMVMKND